jgi:hypothetical protein
MTGKSERPVFFLTQVGSVLPNLVVKGDSPKAHAGESIKWGAKLMKNVQNDQVNTKLMTPSEIETFKQFARNAFPPNSPQYLNVTEARYTWVKMNYVGGLSDGSFLAEDDNPKMKDFKATVGKFLDSGVWFDLGKVVAVDIFNGNSDRFKVADGNKRIPLGTWVNKGNVMFLADGPTKVIGLDTFDPNSARANLTMEGHFEDLKILTDPFRRKTFAEACVASVGSELKRALDDPTRFNPKPQYFVVSSGKKIFPDELPNLYLEYRTNFETGLGLGAGELKIYLQNKVRQYAAQQPPRIVYPGNRLVPMPAPPPLKKIPQGILDRMKFLGW